MSPIRELLIVGNWKMHKTIQESLIYLSAFEPLVRDCRATIALAVPFLAIQPLASSSALLIGAQNMHDAEEGAFTGEISAQMLKEAGARFVLLGHSERRCLFHEIDAFINKKVKSAVQHGLKAILCVGETKEEREKKQADSVIRRQIQEGLAGIDPAQAAHIVLAYEPVWAIGSAHAATPAVIEEEHRFCREVLHALFGKEAGRIPIIYGGSVTPDNAHDLVAQPHVDGLLVGGASLSAESFAKIVHLA